jgi:hypothetical protein
MSIKKIKSIHKIGEKFEAKNPFIKVPCDNHEFEIISVDNNIDVKISNIPQPCIATVFSPYNFRQTIKKKEKEIVIHDVVLYQEYDDSNQTIIGQYVDINTNYGTYRSHSSHPPQNNSGIQISHTPNFCLASAKTHGTW